MAGSIVQQLDGASTATGTTFTTAALGPLTVGNTLVLIVGSDSTVITPTGWFIATTSIENNALYVFYKTVGAGEPTSVTITKNAAAGHTYWIAELAGLQISGQVDKVASHTSAASSTTWTSGTTAATSGSTYAVAALTLWHQNSGGTLVSSWGFYTETSDVITTSSGNTETSVAFLAVLGPATLGATAATSSAVSHGAAAIVAFKTLSPGTAVGVAASSGSAVAVSKVFTAAPAGTVHPVTVTVTQPSAVAVRKATGLHLLAQSASVIVGLCTRQKLVTVAAASTSHVAVQVVHTTTTVGVAVTSTSVVMVDVRRSLFARLVTAQTGSLLSVSLTVNRQPSAPSISFKLGTWLADVEMALMSGDKDERNVLEQTVDEITTDLRFNGNLEGIQPGAYLAIDLEVMYVVSVNEAGSVASVIRGTLESPTSTHLTGSTVYVNPRFTRWQMFKALNAELRDLSAPPNMIFQVKTFSVTTQPVAQTYAVPAANTDIISLLELRYSFPDANRSWPRVPRNRYSILRNMPTDAFPSGMAIRLDEAVYPGRPLQVRYAAPLGEIATLSDDVLSQTGLPLTASDIPPLGAAARLMGVREAKRSFTESAMDSRRAQDVPSGAASRGAAAMMQMLTTRIRSEALRLRSQYPEMV